MKTLPFNYSWTLLFGTWNWGASTSMCRRKQNGAPLVAVQAYTRQSMSGTQHKGLEPQRSCLWHTRGSGSISHDSTKSQRLTSCFLRALALFSLLIIPPTPSQKAPANLPLDHAYISSASGVWPARTKPGKVGLLQDGRSPPQPPSS